MSEILSAAIACFVLTLLGLGIGFIFLQVQTKT